MNYQNKKSFELNLLIIFIFSLFSLIYFLTIPISVVDSYTLRNIMINSHFFIFGSTYNNAALFFNLLGFHYNTSNFIIHFFSWSVFQLFLFTILRINNYREFSISEILYIIFFIVMYGVFFSNFSKDLILILFLLISINFYLNNYNMLYLIIFIGGYGAIFRPYWLILFVFSIFIYIQKYPKIKNNIIYIIIISFLFITIYDLWNGKFITVFRLFGNSNANTLIDNLLPSTSILNDIINYIYALISFIIPIQGFKGNHEIIYYLWILSIILFISNNKYKINSKLTLMFISYISIQALFEPDFGSLFRHQLSLFPLLYLILFKNNNCSIKEK